MLNILIPLAGKQSFFPEADYPYPKPLIEINGRTMIERVVENLKAINAEKRFIFIVNSADCRKYHLDNTLQLLTDGEALVLQIDKETKGAACSALLAIDHIGNDSPLVICNADQIFDCDLGQIVENFLSFDAGVITFDSVHPRWSYAELDQNAFLTQATEKNPISKHAIAGFYFFKKGIDYIAGACRMISKDAHVNGNFYVAPVMNELVLQGLKIRAIQVPAREYHSFYSPTKISEYERLEPVS